MSKIKKTQFGLSALLLAAALLVPASPVSGDGHFGSGGMP
ncbi:MAG: hypothetical protein RJB30_342, partial [Actinomycetota bacterium]